MKSPAICLLLLATFVCVPAPAQILGSAECSPNPAAVGTAISVTIEASAPRRLLTGCGISEVRMGSPTGPVVYTPFICPFILIIVGPGGPYTAQWPGTDNGGTPVPPGTYFIKVDFGDPNAGFPYTPGWFPVRIDDPATTPGPILSTLNTAARGSTLSMQIDSPADANATYVMAASLTANSGFMLPGAGHVALDQDLLFALSFPIAEPSLFSGFVGTLDGNGTTTLPMAMIPNLAGLQGVPLTFQGVILSGSGLSLTNPISRSIQ